MRKDSKYDREFYEGFQDDALKSARIVAPIVVELTKPSSVLDVGCGIGCWLRAFGEVGVEDTYGVDGDWVDQEMLLVAKERFKPVDLGKSISLDRSFDLVVNLEVAEHLAPERADAFVQELVSLGPAILFSAAIPGQGGVGHVNEQWPKYWVEKFEAHGFEVIDCLRRRLWDNDDVSWWYQQNMLLFVKSDLIETSDALKAEKQQDQPGQLSLVHPRQFKVMEDEVVRTRKREHKKAFKQASFRDALRAFRYAFKNLFSNPKD